MKDLQAFKEIPDYKKAGYTIAETAYSLSISKDTVKKYWKLDYDDIEKLFFINSKLYKLSKHENLIISLLSKNPMVSARKISKLIFSIFGESYSERTVSGYLKDLRCKYSLRKEKERF